MSKFKMDDGTVVDTAKAERWEEAEDWNGSNHISRATGSEWEHQTLYRSTKGRYYLVHRSQREGTPPHAEFISDVEACAWLVLMGRDLPKDLQKIEGGVCE